MPHRPGREAGRKQFRVPHLFAPSARSACRPAIRTASPSPLPFLYSGTILNCGDSVFSWNGPGAGHGRRRWTKRDEHREAHASAEPALQRISARMFRTSATLPAQFPPDNAFKWKSLQLTQNKGSMHRLPDNFPGGSIPIFKSPISNFASSGGEKGVNQNQVFFSATH